MNDDPISIIGKCVRHGSAFCSAAPEIQNAILEDGRPFVGIGRPKGYRQRKQKECFRNAFNLSLGGRGVYVEGFVISNAVFYHAWVTLDGVHAIEVTLRDAPDCHYIGVPFSPKVILRWIVRRGDMAPPFFSWEWPIELMREILEDARLHPPVFPSSKDAA
jgi:hypothetical protein